MQTRAAPAVRGGFAAAMHGPGFQWLVRYLWLGLALGLTACASLPPPAAATSSIAAKDISATPLARVATDSLPAEARARGQSGFLLMPEGPTALNARIALIRAARKTLDAQYYILQDDATGLLFLSELLDASRRGVRVRLLVDDLYTPGKDALFAALASQPNFELRLFNPLAVRSGPLAWRLALSLGDLRRVNRRMHNKLLVADNSFAITGGRNIADEYFMRSDQANFVDMDLLAAGPVVPSLSDSFDDFWNSRQVRSIGSLMDLPPNDERTRRLLAERCEERRDLLPEAATDVLGHPPVSEQLANGRLQLTVGDGRAVSDVPEKITYDDPEASFADSVSQRTIAMLYGARREVLMVSPYFVPGEAGLALLQQQAARGVQVLVFTNSLDATDETLVYSGYARYRLAMLKAGVKVFELGSRLVPKERRLGEFKSSTARLHAKVMLVDRERVFIGSMNLDGRSARLNTEVGVIIESPALLAQFTALMPVRELGAYELRLRKDDDGLQWIEHHPDGTQSVLDEEPGVNVIDRVRDWLLLKLLPEDLL
ncbi:phospholipase D family protein [uncultured Pseudacidovorax sp.]|uniref:phospholipase D family protein n=1 Tax=uncultured Pseudacidovorax sp. TaxID=679313 RepID=UPI0025DC0A71|nr:phospholipase D family protein [uncultured Pseudacidovorax sp.]